MPVDDLMRQEAAMFAGTKSLPQPLVTVGRARGIGCGFDGAPAIGPRMNDNFEAACFVYHEGDIGPEPDIRSQGPLASAQANPRFA